MDMDWDDDDEKTSVYEKGGQEDAARALLRSAPPPAAGAPPPAAGSPAAEHRVGATGGATAPLSRGEPRVIARAQPAPAPSSGRWLMLTAALITLAAVATALLFVVGPFAKASIVITVAGPANKAIDAVEIVVEDAGGVIVKQCDRSPCAVSDIAPGTYVIKASAAGYDAPAPEPLKLGRGENDPHKILLAKATRGTGIRVTSLGTGLRLSLDGKDQGPLPATIDDLLPGDYVVRLSDEKGRYEPWEKTVTVTKNEVVSLEPTLKVLKGLAKIKPGQNAEGARVLLVSGSERRPLPRLPISIEITPEKPYQLVANRAGYQDYVREIHFDDGIAEKTFEVTLTPVGQAAPPAPAPVARSTPRSPPATAPRTTPSPAAATIGGTGTISINSLPQSNVLVNGRPVGTTPTQWKGPPGNYTVVFVHPEHGRKSKTVTVKPGGTSVASVRFP